MGPSLLLAPGLRQPAVKPEDDPCLRAIIEAWPKVSEVIRPQAADLIEALPKMVDTDAARILGAIMGAFWQQAEQRPPRK